MRSFQKLCAAATMLLMTCLARGQTTVPAIEPTTQPATAPASQPSVSPAAAVLLDELRNAYTKLSRLDLAGTVSFELDAAGRKESQKAEFSGSFVAPANFRHEMKDDLLVVSNGEKAFVYKIDQKRYLSLDAPKDRSAAQDLPGPIGMQLQQQNPSLLLSVVKDPAAELSAGATSIDRMPDVALDGISYPVLTLDSQGQKVRLLLEPQTHLLRQITVDLKEHLAAQGMAQVNKALVTIDYNKSQADGAPTAAAFSWTPPADAQQVKPDQQPPGEEANASDELVGKPAPDFSLKDLADKNVSLAAQKGSVVVLDFWATWCPPCQKSLPHLSQLNSDLSAQGLKVFAIDLREAKDVVQKFIDERKLTMPVLLDSDGKTAEQYKVTGIPQTVVIGKDGKVKKVIVGFEPGGEKELRSVVEAAMKE